MNEKTTMQNTRVNLVKGSGSKNDFITTPKIIQTLYSEIVTKSRLYFKIVINITPTPNSQSSVFVAPVCAFYYIE